MSSPLTKTCLYNFDPAETPLLYSKTGFYRGILFFSYFCSKNIDCGYSLELPHLSEQFRLQEPHGQKAVFADTVILRFVILTFNFNQHLT